MIFVKKHRLLLAALCASMLSPLASADVSHAAHHMKDATVRGVKKTGEVAREAAHGTAHAARTVAHDIAAKTREGYHAARRAVHKEA